MQLRVYIGRLVVLLMCVTCGCSSTSTEQTGPSDPSESGPASVYVVNYPLQYFAERIGGDHVAVKLPAPPDGDPAFWTPTAEDIVGYQQADLILLNGADYARWVPTVSLPESKVIDTSASCSDQLIQLDGAATHSHGPEGEHAHGGVAFTTWLDPQLAIQQARAVADAFVARWPEEEKPFEAGFAALSEDLMDLDAATEKSLANAGRDPLLFSHPVFQYFERRYGLNGKSVHWEPDEVPTTEQWDELAEILESHQAKWMIWEGEPVEETVLRLREMGVDCIVFAPCGNTPEEGDYLTVMQKNVSELTASLGE